MNALAATLERLDDAALETLASKGLVRRARRDVDANLAVIEDQGETGATVRVDGETVTLTGAGLGAARCTCPAPGICRHKLGAVMVLRGDGPAASPAGAAPAADPTAEIVAASEAQVVKAFGKPAVRAAASLVADSETIAITTGGGACVVLIPDQPEVRITAAFAPDGIVSKARGARAKTLHAAAVLAVRRAAGIALPVLPAAKAAAAEDLPRPEAAILARARAALDDAARFAFSAAPEALEDRLFDLAVAARAADLPNLAARLRRLSRDVRHKREHDPAFEPAGTLSALATTYALVEALGRHPDNRALRGLVREEYASAGDLTMIGCGLELWRTGTGARGVTTHLYEPDGGRWFSVTLGRTADQDPSFDSERAARSESVWGTTLRQAAGGTVCLRDAKAAASGRISTSRETRVEVEPWVVRRDEAASWPGFFTDWGALGADLGERFGPSLRAARKDGTVVALLPEAIDPPVFDELEQTIVLPVRDRAGRVLALTCSNVPGRERRFDAIEAMRGGPHPWLVFAGVTVDEDRFSLSPFAVVRQDDVAPVPLDLGLPGRRASLASRLLRQAGDMFGVRGQRPPPVRQQERTGAVLAAVLDEVLALCELGGRMQDERRTARIAALAERLDAAGLPPLASLLARVAAADETARPEAILRFAHAAECWRGLSRQMPLM